jgi:predicted PurR-regulated permease PerM
MSEAKLEAYFFSALFIGVLILTVRLFYPFLGALALALVLASLGMPLYDRIRARIHHESMAALIVVLVMTGAVLFPAVLLFFLLMNEVTSVTQSAAQLDPGVITGTFYALETRIHEVLPMMASFDIGTFVRSSTLALGSYGVTLLTSTASALFKLFIAIFALYYFIKDGHRFVRALVQLSPLTDDEDAQIIQKLRLVSRSLIRETLVIAILQGMLTGVGFLLAGIPNPVLWGAVGAIGSLVPNIGTSIVFVPGVLYLLMTGAVPVGIGLALWGFVVVGLADNLVRPFLVGRAMHIHPLFVLLSVLGGIAVFGISGFLLGPLTLGLLVALSEIYKVKINEIHTVTAE